MGYASAWQDYRDAGWTPVPLPRGEKEYPPKGTTGDTSYRFTPTVKDYRRWAHEYPDGNIALVMPEGCVGIDIDCYGEKQGAETRARLERDNGPLPITWETTSRDDGISGIGMYRVPLETRLRGVAGPGIEVCQWWHRYCIVWPSIHPTGRRYDWWMGQGAADIPKVVALPDLPRKWIKALADRPKSQGGGSTYDGDVDDWLNALPQVPEGFAPASVRRVLRQAERRFYDGSCRHDEMVKAIGALVSMGAAGRPVYDAIYELGDLFCNAVASDRDGDEDWEYSSALAGAVRKFGGTKPRKRSGISDEALTEAAARIARRMA